MLKNRERLLISLPPELKDWAMEESVRQGISAAKFIERVLGEKRAEGKDVPPAREKEERKTAHPAPQKKRAPAGKTPRARENWF